MKQLELKDFLNYTYLASLTTSPAKKHMAFIKSNARYDENDYVHDLYLTDGSTHKRIFDLGNDSLYFWETDDTLLIPTSRIESEKNALKAKHSVFYRYDIHSGELNHAYTFKFPVGFLKVIDDNHLLLSGSLSVTDHVFLEGDDEARSKYNAETEANTYYEVFEEIPFYSNGGGFNQAKRSQLFIYTIDEDRYTALSDKNEDISLYHFDKEKQCMIYAREVAMGKPDFFQDLYLYDFKKNEETALYTKHDFSFSSVFILNDTVYALGSNLQKHGINQNSDLYQITHNALIKIQDFGLSAWGSIGSDVRFAGSVTNRVVDDIYYFVGTYRDRTVLYSFDGTSIKRAFDALGSLDAWVKFNDDFYGIGLYNNNLQEFYRLDLANNTVSRVSEFNQSILKDTYIAKPEHFEYTNDGQLLDGWVLLPQDYDPSQSYPAILDIHGGPKTIYSDVFYHEMQVWANKGYIVFFTNPRGGDVYGNEFMDIFGRYGDVDYDDLMKFTDIVLDRYAIDPKRVGVTGGSYGGFMTNWIVGHTDRFKCAATQRSISNWISFYGTSDIGFYFADDQTAADPIEDTEKMWHQSPLKYARNVKTPLLFIHSDEDYRCPIEQGMQFFTYIKENGVDTRFVWLRGENHDLSRTGKPKARVKRLEEITNWMDKYLK
ncbi:S9 family peptidase [Erysipelothrix rhusiopathiae]|nr:S9 family peptidase [Erysipelothrix rhusiopathiae]MDE8120152.1 S9 family peptidase [Erysipelothrix rhusiopathiae]MDE8133478.1 S9 family peptidase [Erysipelothrix rhusiopathiae]MDE8148082.1 S9 family peptidase [Erysipelothrix rhusiopathiae]MDE8195700.1 S9 family peptidase [Erysipelothrix rhusiopathiae]